MKKDRDPIMTLTILVTGASTGIGNLTARTLATVGHRVYASMRDVSGRNAGHARDLVNFAAANGLNLKVIDLDVQSQDSADAAVTTILDDAGRLDAVVHNAGHLVIGYAEAFTAEDLAHLFDRNAQHSPIGCCHGGGVDPLARQHANLADEVTRTIGGDNALFLWLATMHEDPYVTLENHDQVANTARGVRLHQMTSPGRFRARTALTTPVA